MIGFFLIFPSIASASSINASDLMLMANGKRTESGLEELSPNQKLTQAAHEKAVDIITNHYFAHTTPSGKPFYEWVEEAGYYYLYAGENLAIDFNTNEAVIDAWMASATHRANILNKNYKDIGIAVMRGDWDDRETTVAVQMFGSLLEDAPTVLGKALENISMDIGLRRESLKELSSGAIIIPSIAGNEYFDIILKTGKEINISATNPNKDSIAQSPITKVVQGSNYITLLKTKDECCLKEATFALTQEKNGMLLSAPLSLPSLSRILSNLKTIKFILSNVPQNLYHNLLIAGFVSMLLLAAYEQEIKKELWPNGLSGKKLSKYLLP